MRPLVRLYHLGGLGLIITLPTGVLYSNQTGGTSCLQPEIEGAFVPLLDDERAPDGGFDAAARLLGYFTSDKHGGAGATLGLDTADADFIDDTLTHAGFAHALRVDRNRLRASHEAWVWVVVREDERETKWLLEGLGSDPRVGVLTWNNSD